MPTQTVANSSSLKYVKTIGLYGFGKRRGGSMVGFANAYDLAFSRDGRIFVLNRYTLLNPYYSGRISICTFDEEFLEEFNIDHGDGQGQCKVASAMAFDSEDRLHIVDEYIHRVLTVDTSGAFLGQWGEHGDGAGQLSGPTSIAIDSEDNCYIVEQHNHRVQVFTRDGKYLHHWGGFGDGDGQFNMPWGIALDSEGNVWVADWRNDRVQKFTPDGRFLAKYGQSGEGDGQFHRPSSVAVDDEGYIYVADWGNERVQVLGPDGGFVQNLRGQATMSKWAEEYMANPMVEKEPQVRADANLIPPKSSLLDTPYLVSSQTEPYFWGITKLALDGEGRLYVAECNRSRFQIYQRA
jgi:DNA-binding beta-propeller fold protein YncE